MQNLQHMNTLKKMIAGVTIVAVAISMTLVLGMQQASAATLQNNTSGSVSGTQGGTSLGELIVLQEIFQDGQGTDQNTSFSDLGELIVLNNLFSGQNGLFSSGGQSGSSTSGQTSLGELIVLQSIFGDGEQQAMNGATDGTTDTNQENQGTFSDLGELIVLNNLFSGSSVFGSGQQTVIVERGDTLAGIAETYLGDASRWPEIAAMNNISNPRNLQIGQRLVLPSSQTTGSGMMSGQTNLGELIVLQGIFDSEGQNGGGGLGNFSELGELIILNNLFSNGQGGLF